MLFGWQGRSACAVAVGGGLCGLCRAALFVDGVATDPRLTPALHFHVEYALKRVVGEVALLLGPLQAGGKGPRPAPESGAEDRKRSREASSEEPLRRKKDKKDKSKKEKKEAKAVKSGKELKQRPRSRGRSPRSSAREREVSEKRLAVKEESYEYTSVSPDPEAVSSSWRPSLSRGERTAEPHAPWIILRGRIPKPCQLRLLLRRDLRTRAVSEKGRKKEG